jgi:membrane-associated protease RseP (regulator of RpoE activity)
MFDPGLAYHVREALSDLFEVHEVTLGRHGEARLRGRLLRPADEAYELAAKRLQLLGYTPLFRRQGDDDIVFALPHLLQSPPSRRWPGLVLFGLTVLSTLLVGASMAGWVPRRGLGALFTMGAPFALTLLAILGAHELGHYFAGRYHGVPVTLPYFIPMPLSIFGTMGAFIRLKAPPTNRRVLLAIAAAGPLAGLAVALPLLVVGLRLSPLGPLALPGEGAVLEGNSLLYAGLKYLIFGRFLPGDGLDVHLHPIAFAAWAGLFVTGLNLIPAGQLDGGHAIYALIGTRARYLTMAITMALLGLGFFVWPGWYLWAGLVFVFGQTFATPLDDITRLDARGVALALLMLVVFALIFTPIPLMEL